MKFVLQVLVVSSILLLGSFAYAYDKGQCLLKYTIYQKLSFQKAPHKVRDQISKMGTLWFSDKQSDSLSPSEFRFGKKSSEDFILRLTQLREDLVSLKYDFNLFVYLSEFEQFFRENEKVLLGLSAKEVRAKFSEEFGKSKWFRSLVLTNEEYQQVLKYGMTSKELQKVLKSLSTGELNVRFSDGGKQFVEQNGKTFGLRNSDSMYKTFFKKIEGFESSPILSVSKTQILAEGVGQWFMDSFRRLAPGADKIYSVYIFEIEISNLEVFSPKKLLERLSEVDPDYIKEVKGLNNIHMSYQFVNRRGDSIQTTIPLSNPNLESHIYYYIGPQEISKSWKVESQRAKFLNSTNI